MQPLTRCSVLLSLLSLLGTGFAPRLAAQTSTVRCESRGTSQEQCPIPSNARVELTRPLSPVACREGYNWGVGTSFIWVNRGCRAEFAVTSTGYDQGQGNASANRNQLRACRSEADRRLANYSYDQISVEPDSRQGSVAYVRWWAGSTGGLCAVAANGRVLQFTTNLAGGGGGGGTTRVACESQRYGRQECPIPAGASIRLLRQTGQDPCRLNDTYGQGAGYIWVAKGCRGEFEVVTAGGGGGTGSGRVVCASSTNTRRQCAIPPGAQARLVRQMSEVPCRTGQNWGVGPDFVWVTRGCSGEFEVTGSAGGGGGATGGVRRIVCESRTAARVVCPVVGATAIRLVQQLSTNPCRLNQSFGIGLGHMWVSSGCRGEFEVALGGALPGAGEGTGLPNRVVCESRGGERTECRIRVGGQVRLVRQIGTVPCTANNTWGSGYGMIWVTKGCRGEFEVR